MEAQIRVEAIGVLKDVFIVLLIMFSAEKSAKPIDGRGRSFEISARFL
jgi:hypothetical protein